MAVLLNVVFNEVAAGNRPRSSVFSAVANRVVSAEQLAGLREGDRVEDGAAGPPRRAGAREVARLVRRAAGSEGEGQAFLHATMRG